MKCPRAYRKARLDSAGFEHLDRRHDIRLSIRGGVRTAAVIWVQHYSSKAWVLRIYIRRLSASERRRPGSIGRI